MVHVPFGGTADYAGPGDIAVPFHTREPVPKSYRWDEGATWAGFEIRDLAAAMAHAAAPGAFERPPGFERFEFGAVGQLMRERVLGVLRREMPTLEGLPT